MWKGSSSLSCWPASRSALQRSTLTRQKRCWKTEKTENAEWCITLPALLEAEARCDCSSLEWIHSPSLGLCFRPVWKRRETSNLFFFSCGWKVFFGWWSIQRPWLCIKERLITGPKINPQSVIIINWDLKVYLPITARARYSSFFL